MEFETSSPGENEQRYWMRNVERARKREKDFRKKAKEVIDIYECEDESQVPFNILYSNTDTMAPALFNAHPRPVVSRRHRDADLLGLAGARTLERSISFLIDDPDSRYTPFDDLMHDAVLQALVPGRGVVRWKYDATFGLGPGPVPDEPQDELTPEDGDETPSTRVQGEEAEAPEEALEGPAAGTGAEQLMGAEQLAEPPVPPAQEMVESETVCGELVSWDSFAFGYAKRWEDVPWVGFLHKMTRADLIANFGPKIGQQVELQDVEETETGGEDEGEGSVSGEKSTTRVAIVWEIWHKSRKSVIFVSEGFKNGVLKRAKDPLRLTGFFPVARPLELFHRLGISAPVPLYATYEMQARELNRITVRINKIVEALKIRGFYDSGLSGIEMLMEKPDNTLLPAKGIGQIRDGATPENSIWFMPIEKLVPVLQQLYIQRETVKRVIYEITGVADIMRGSSVASETLGAQQLKNQWGTMRLSRMQKRVQEFVRENLRIMAELVAEHFDITTLQAMTGLPYPTEQDRQEAQMQMQQLQMQMQQMQMQAPPMDPMAPPDPAAQQMQGQMQQMQGQIQQYQLVAAAPSWEEIKQFLSEDRVRAYKVDIETNSTVDPEAVEDQKSIAEMMTALGQLFQSLLPAVQQGALTMPAFKAMVLAITRRYRFGPEVEDSIMQIPDQLPPPAPPPGEAPQETEDDDGVSEERDKLESEKMKFDYERKLAAMEEKYKKQSAGPAQPAARGAKQAADSSMPAVMEALKTLDSSRQASEAALMMGLKMIAEKLSAPKKVVVKQPNGKSMEFSVGSSSVQ